MFADSLQRKVVLDFYYDISDIQKLNARHGWLVRAENSLAQNGTKPLSHIARKSLDRVGLAML